MKLKVHGVDKVVSNLDIFVKKQGQMVSRAMNDTHGVAYTAASKNTRKFYNIKAKDLKKKDAVKRANSSNPTLVFSLKTFSIPLLEFTGRNKGVRKTGISYKVLKQQRAKIFKHAFINTSISRHSEYVLIRDTALHGKKGGRYPIIPLTVISPTTMFIKSKSEDVYIDTFFKGFEKRYLHYIRYLTENNIKKYK